MTKLRPWFGNERTLDEQWRGLERIDYWQGKSVLDIGCAEGSICKRILGLGADSVLGIDVRKDYVEAAKKGADPEREDYVCRDLNYGLPPLEPRDIVLLLAVLHKLKRPLELLEQAARLCDGLLVIRLPPETGPVIVDLRSGGVRIDTHPVMLKAGFRLTDEHYEGPRGEYMAYWRR